MNSMAPRYEKIDNLIGHSCVGVEVNKIRCVKSSKGHLFASPIFTHDIPSFCFLILGTTPTSVITEAVITAHS